MLESAEARYGIGLLAALISTSAINLGLVMQKQAVARGSGEGLFRRLVRDRLWLAGFLLQTLVGMPLNVAAVALAGPASVPGIMALGLVVLAAASAFYARERLERRELAGIGIVMLGVMAVAAAGLGVDVFASSPSAGELPGRTALLAALMIGLALGGERVAARRERLNRRSSPGTLAAASGSWNALSNLSLGVVTAAAAAILAGGAPFADYLIIALSLLALLSSSIRAVILTQRAFLRGKATIVVPVQQAPMQIFAPLSFLLVYRPRPPSDMELAFAFLGAGLAVAGALFLSTGHRRREDSGRALRPARG